MLKRLAAGLKAVLSLVFPFFQKARASGRLTGVVWAVLHVLILIAVVAGLHYLNRFFHIDQLLEVRREFDFLRPWWLPILFLLGYSFCWLSWWLWQLLFPDSEPAAFPDIEQAWEQACAALEGAYLPLKSLPLFLVLGTPEDDEEAIFQGWQVRISAPPVASKPPLRVYATQEAIFVTCAGASSLGFHARNLSGQVADQNRQEQAGEDDDVLQTLSPRSSRRLDPNRAVEKMVGVLIQAEREKRDLTKAEKRELRCSYRQDNPQRSVLKHPELIDEQVARLGYLCRLIVRDRAPYCPANGILLLLPFAGLDSNTDASDTGIVCQHDLKTAISTLRVHCPLFVLVCDLETAPGFSDFVKQFKARERAQRIGQRCHLIPDLPLTSGQDENGEPPQARLVRSMVDQVCNAIVKKFVADKFQIEQDSNKLYSVVVSNSRLFLFFDELQQRSKRLGDILAKVVVTERDPKRLLFGGCYLGATGRDAAQEQVWVKGVIDRLIGSENCVYWADPALEEEAIYQRWLVAGWTLVGIVLVALAVLVVLGWGFIG